MSDFKISTRARSSGLAEASWSQGVLTLISIILGAAVAVGAQRMFEIAVGSVGIRLLDLVHALSAFMFITGTYYHIYTVVSFFFILPNIIWVMLPTSVGIGVVMSSYAIGNTKYFLVAAIVFYGFGALTFFYALVERYFKRIGLLAHDAIDASRAYRIFAIEMTKNTTCFIAMLAVSVALYYATLSSPTWLMLPPEALFVLANGLIYSIMVWCTEMRFLPAVREIWQLDKAPHIDT